MKKKIAADLTSLAHRILQLKNKEDVNELQVIAKELYEKLTVLSFTEKHFADIKPTAGDAEVERRLSQAFTEAQEDVNSITGEVDQAMEQTQEDVAEAFANNDLSDLFMPADEDTREEMELPGISTISKMVEEMPDEVPETSAKIDMSDEETPNPIPTEIKMPEFEKKETVEEKLPPIEIPDHKKYTKNDLEDITADFQTMPVFERKINDAKADEKPLSLNDRLNKGLKFGMNDRLGFIKHLFNGSDQDFNRVISQLNTRNTYEDAQSFINNMVKPDYNNWEGKETYANRFMELVERNY
ncbi:hypothetical protein LX97_01127 [Nonlabens dokdonensis]|uniref:Uncharacterized protein n=2 Tax=Nonlabens dokdonensis TaxID=328515 RepID=L7W9E6_NONDD|nr:hypothetical protein [Nonlabens dokdonensis]AGC76461.1 hypothetical protein DDD_1334 [Nonlabens dokdonensis DSW-6]PZX44118.1 hypothetical protein LX97_01127 [Nonlabens dokdonensis]